MDYQRYGRYSPSRANNRPKINQEPRVTSYNNGEGCNYPSLAMVYSPYQELNCTKDIYDYQTALERGTLFPALDKPFKCGGSANERKN